MMRSGAIKGAGPFFSGREPHVPAIQSYPTPKQIYLHVTPPTGNSEEAFLLPSVQRRGCPLLLVTHVLTGEPARVRDVCVLRERGDARAWPPGTAAAICRGTGP